MSGTVTIPNGNNLQYDNTLNETSGTVIPSLVNGAAPIIQSYKTVSATGAAGNPGTVQVTVSVSGMPSGVGIRYEIYVDGTSVANAILTGSGSLSHTLTGRSRSSAVTVEVGQGMGGSPYTLSATGTVVLSVTAGDWGS